MDKYFDIFVNCSPIIIIILGILYESVEETNYVKVKYTLAGILFSYYIFCCILYYKGYGNFILSIIYGGIISITFIVFFIMAIFKNENYFSYESKNDYIVNIIISFIFLVWSMYFFIHRLRIDMEIINKYISNFKNIISDFKEIISYLKEIISDFKNFSSLIINGLLSIEIDNDLIREIFIATIGSVLAGIVLKILIKK